MQIKIEITTEELKALVHKEIEAKMDAAIDPKLIHIEVKSKQNYKSEWEPAAFRAIYEGEI